MKTIFWNVDTQYDFMRDDDSFKGALAVKDARAIEGNLEKLTKLARARGIKIVNTADWHTPRSAELSDKPDFITTFPPHCMQNTKGAQYVRATLPIGPYTVDWQYHGFDAKKVAECHELVLLKDKFDIFAGNKHADAVVKLINPDRAIVYGVATNVCVRDAVNGLLERNVQVYVPTDAIKELPHLPLEPVLDAWKAKGAVFIKTADVERYL